MLAGGNGFKVMLGPTLWEGADASGIQSFLCQSKRTMQNQRCWVKVYPRHRAHRVCLTSRTQSFIIEDCSNSVLALICMARRTNYDNCNWHLGVFCEDMVNLFRNFDLLIRDANPENCFLKNYQLAGCYILSTKSAQLDNKSLGYDLVP